MSNPFTRFLIAFAAIAGPASPALAWQGPGEAAFTLRMAERFRAAFPERAVEILGPLELRVGTGDDAATINVGRAFRFCADSNAEECDAFAAHFVTAVGETDAQDTIRPEQLRVMIRHAGYCDELETMARDAEEAHKFVLRPFAPQLCALLVADFPNAMRTLNRGDLGALALEADAAWTLAERQTLANLPRPEAIEGLGDQLVLVSDLDYVPSLMLNLEGWRRADAAVGGDLVIAVPADGILVASRRANLNDLDAFKATTVDAFLNGERGISPLVYRPTEAGWAPVE